MLRIKPECVPCTIQIGLKTARYASNNPEVHRRVVQALAKRLAHVSWEECPFEFAFVVQETVFNVSGIRDPYFEVKRDSNRRALSLYLGIKRIISTSENPLKLAAKFAALGNFLDFTMYPEIDLELMSSDIGNMDFIVRGFDKFEEYVRDAEKLIYFLDNAGEIVFDKILVETMMDVRGRAFENITIVPKEESLVNDATVNDVEEVSFTELPNVVVKPVGSGRKSAPYPRSRDVKKWIEEHDLVIFKGQANFELFLDEPDAFFILVTKCPIVAGVLGVSQGSMVLTHSSYLSKT